MALTGLRKVGPDMYSRHDVENRKSLKYVFGHYKVGNIQFLNIMLLVHFSVFFNFVIMVVKGRPNLLQLGSVEGLY